MSLYNFKYGNRNIEINLEGKITSILPNKTEHIENIKAKIIESIENPIGSKPLSEIVKPGEKVLLVVSDITRLWIKINKFLIYVVNYLNSLGIKDEDISTIIAVGTHRADTEGEKISIVGKELYKRIKIYNHDSKNADELDYIGISSFGTPEYINKKVVDADRVILIGGITFHLFAGFGGGAKSIVPGVAGIKTIQHNHKLVFNNGENSGLNLDARANKIKGNPMREDITEICRTVSVDFLINAVLDTNGNFVEFVAGDFEKAWMRGCNTIRKLYAIKVKEKADITIASAGGYPKDINLYQSVKTIGNSLYAGVEDSVLIVIAECREGVGTDEFTKLFKYKTLNDMETALKKDFTVPGYAAYKTLYSSKHRKIFLVSSLEDEIVRKFGFIPVKSLKNAVELAYKLSVDNPRIALIPYGGDTLPV
ncbi:nickel-dependent lactate racemase [Clostridium sp. MT-14]|uniref:Nickel-dependent lactate racemase n=1 Tax=Clostridium aromativorans TaxID=2836848 RepID=A0ABS8N6R7_9CLOT|nr:MULTISPECIES: nickel-dependent lactate racemase [Clostridium]KAA8666586.1 nickel-dependent lactate racemase [Clostridium sp. HV4-5-A1G]MCC9295506.1 nickel-dependent lactate racemase [Clostridium aromativorans]